MFLLRGRPDIRWYIFNLSSRYLESGVFLLEEEMGRM